MLVSILYKLKLYYNLKCYFQSMYIFHIHIFKITIISTYFSPFLLKMYIFKIRHDWYQIDKSYITEIRYFNIYGSYKGTCAFKRTPSGQMTIKNLSLSIQNFAWHTVWLFACLNKWINTFKTQYQNFCWFSKTFQKLFQIKNFNLRPGVTRIGPWHPFACRMRRLNWATCLPWVAARVGGEGAFWFTEITTWMVFIKLKSNPNWSPTYPECCVFGTRINKLTKHSYIFIMEVNAAAVA